MSPLRIVGYVCLAVLTAMMLLLIGLSIAQKNWQLMAIGLGSLLLFAFLGYGLWLEGFKQRQPNVTVAPQRTLPRTLLIVLGLSIGAFAIKNVMAERWLHACLDLIASVVLLEQAYRAFKRN